jgi:hypothetical protein
VLIKQQLVLAVLRIDFSQVINASNAILRANLALEVLLYNVAAQIVKLVKLTHLLVYRALMVIF